MYTSIKSLICPLEERLKKEFDIPAGFIWIEQNKNQSETIWLTEPVTNVKSKFVLNYSLKGKQKEKHPCFEVPNSLCLTRSLKWWNYQNRLI